MSAAFRATRIASLLWAPRSKLSRRWGTRRNTSRMASTKAAQPHALQQEWATVFSRPTAVSRLIDVPRRLPVIEAARKGRPDDPGLPVAGCAYLRLSDGVAPVVEQV